MLTLNRPKRHRLTKIEREAIRMVLQETLAGDVVEFFKDGCGLTEKEAEKLAAALTSGANKI